MFFFCIKERSKNRKESWEKQYNLYYKKCYVIIYVYKKSDYSIVNGQPRKEYVQWETLYR